MIKDIKLTDETHQRLAVYKAANGLGSFDRAINHLLDEAAGGAAPSPEEEEE